MISARKLPKQIAQRLKGVAAEIAAETGRQAKAAVNETFKTVTSPLTGEPSQKAESMPPRPDIARIQEADTKEIAQLQALLTKEKGGKTEEQREARPAGATRNIENEMAIERRKRQERERERIKEFVGKIHEQRNQEARTAQAEASVFARKKPKPKRGGAFAHVKRAQTQVESRVGSE